MNRFLQVEWADQRFLIQICDRPGNLQNPMASPYTELVMFGSILKQAGAFTVQRAELRQHVRRDMGIRLKGQMDKAAAL